MLFLKKCFSVCWLLFVIFNQINGSNRTISTESVCGEQLMDVSNEGLANFSDSPLDESEGTTLPEPTIIVSSSTTTSTTMRSTSTSTRRTRRPRPTRPQQSSPSSENLSSTVMMSTSGRVSTPTTITVSEQIVKCNSDGSYNGHYEVQCWPPVPIGQQSLAKCPHGDGQAKWMCLEMGIFDLRGPDFSNCTDWLVELQDLDMEDMERANHIIEFISNKTVNNTIKESERLSKVFDVISKVQTFVDNANDSDFNNLELYANNIVETFTHIMDQKQAWVNSTGQEKKTMASKILIGTLSTSYALSLQQNSSNSFVRIQNNDFYINTFYTNSSSELKFPSNEINGNYSTIIIPANTAFVNSSLVRNTTAIGAIIHNLNGYMIADMEENNEINSEILSFSLANSTERILLNQEVTIKLKHRHRLQFGDRVDCVFWDFNQSKWSSEGCYRLANESDLLQTVCKCNHLTNFAALMDIGGRESKTLLKSLLTYLCSVLSIFGLMFTINLIIRSKHNSNNTQRSGSLDEMRSIITCNLCICLLLTNLFVIALMDKTDILWLCQLSSALLLYSLLSSFCWMLMEGYYLYKSLVAVFNADFKASYLYGVGYGLPIAIFLISFIIIYMKEDILLEALFDERYSYFCWISSSHYPSHIWILIAPAVCVIICNCVLMFISLRTAFKILKNQNSFGMKCEKTQLKFRQIVSFVFFLFLLGITWLSFLFYINQFFANIFSYIHIVLNGSQGFFIFLYHLSIYDFKGNRRADSVNSSKSNLI